MRCPNCGIELNSRSERCPHCGSSLKAARHDGDAMERVRRRIAIISGGELERADDVQQASFSPVLTFDKKTESREDEQTYYNLTESGILDNPADNFDSLDFKPVDVAELLGRSDGETEMSVTEAVYDTDEAELKHRINSAKIRYMVGNKEDDLLADYYFEGGVSDIESYMLEQSFILAQAEGSDGGVGNKSDGISEGEAHEKIAEKGSGEEEISKPDEGEIQHEELSESAKRLSEFPEEEGLDKVLTVVGENFDKFSAACRERFNRFIYSPLRRFYNSLDKKTAPYLDKLLDRFYYVRFKNLKRKAEEDKTAEKRRLRKVIWSCVLGLAAILICLGFFVASLFTQDIAGEWIVSYDVSGDANIITEFTASGNVIVSVKSDDGWHVHKQGTYKTQRKNGNNLLTITYEDGTVSRLYYTIDGNEGTFQNVETNEESTYVLK